MAKYDVTMSCGHVQTVQLFGKMIERDKKIAWLEKNGICTECQKAETERKHAEETAKAAEKAVADKLPELTGTEKQVNWALTIRANIFTELDKMLENKKSRMDAETFAENELQVKAIKNVLAKFTEARFWIDNRDKGAGLIIKSNNLADEIKAEITNFKTIEATDDICTADAVDASVTAMQDMTTEETEQETSDEEYHKKIMKELAEVYGEPTTLEKCREEFGALGDVVYNTYLMVSNATPVTLEEYQVAYNDDELGTQKYNEANGIKPKSDDVDDNAKNPPLLAYNLGKIFATLQRIINVQKGDLDVYTAKTGGAGKICDFPLIELANQQRKANESLLKIKSRNADLAEKFERELCVVYDLLPADLPHQLTFDVQNYFLLGYYHQGSYMDAANFGKRD